MTRTPGLERLEALGFDEPAARTRLDLIERVLCAHDQWTGRRPSWCWFVPGRVEIFGKHTDYAGGRSLLAAVPRGFALAGSPREDAVVRLCDANSRETGVLAPGDTTPPPVRGMGYVAAVVRRLRLNFPGASIGADLTIASDLPRAAGLSSSSALVVAVATALIRRGGLDERPEWRAAIQTPDDLAAYFGAVERGAAFGDLGGTEAVGVFGGSEDHTAILNCRAGLVSAFRFVPIRRLGEAPMPAGWRFVIAESGVEADKAGRARDRYNRASLAAEALVALWNTTRGARCVTLDDVLATSAAATEQLDEAAAGSRSNAYPPELLRRRLSHFVAEDARVPQALDAFLAADAARLGELARASQADAEAWLENQTEETRQLAQLAVEQGAFAASSFGAGFGGSVWALTAAGEADRFGERWIARYRSCWPTMTRASWFSARPAPALFQWL